MVQHIVLQYIMLIQQMAHSVIMIEYFAAITRLVTLLTIRLIIIKSMFCMLVCVLCSYMTYCRLAYTSIATNTC